MNSCGSGELLRVWVNKQEVLFTKDWKLFNILITDAAQFMSTSFKLALILTHALLTSLTCSKTYNAAL